jgi:ligand-binding SRPBCC domain-containing protein
MLAGEMSDVLLSSQRVAPRAAERLGFRFAHPALAGALADLCADPAHVVEREQLVRRPPDQVFPFFSDARNLERITPDFLRFRVAGMSTPEVRQGTLIDYRLRLHGVPVGWRTRIDEWRPGERFVDVQLCGPYSLWQHTHEFEPVPQGTIVRDRIRYRLPFGALGDLLAGPFVARDVEKIFAHRQARIDHLLGSDFHTRAESTARG